VLKNIQSRRPGERVGEIVTLEGILAYLTTDEHGDARRVGTTGWSENTAATAARAIRAFCRFNLRSVTLIVVASKGDKERHVGLVPTARGFLEEWRSAAPPT